jgi:hypothetical protein
MPRTGTRGAFRLALAITTRQWVRPGRRPHSGAGRPGQPAPGSRCRSASASARSFAALAASSRGRGLAGDEQRERDRTAADISERRAVGAERLVRPDDRAVREGDHHAAPVVELDERQLELDAVQQIAGAHAIGGLRRVHPAGPGERGADRVGVGSPHGDVDVVVGARDRPCPQIDGPAPEQPMVDLGGVEGLRERRDGLELLCRPGGRRGVQRPKNAMSPACW